MARDSRRVRGLGLSAGAGPGGRGLGSGCRWRLGERGV